MKNYKVTCRYGIPYSVKLSGTNGEIARTIHMLENCCCWVCHNRDCDCPKNEKINNCGNTCELWTENHYCER